MKQLVFAITIPVLAVAAWVHLGVSPAAGQAGRRVLPQPTNWVAFIADLHRTCPGQPDVFGRIYRASDGSERVETGPARDVIEVVSINNFAEARHYEFSTSRGWISQPMVLPPDGYTPRPVPSDLDGLRPHETRVAGFEVYAYSKGDMVVSQAPALNFFPLVMQELTTGIRTEYHNVVLTEPAPHLFRPPADAVVTQLTTPGGFVYFTGRDDPNAQIRRPPECTTPECRERLPKR